MLCGILSKRMADAFPSTKSWYLQSFVDFRSCVLAWLQVLLELPTLKAVDINPLTPLLYVFTLCFICSPMGQLPLAKEIAPMGDFFCALGVTPRPPNPRPPTPFWWVDIVKSLKSS